MTIIKNEGCFFSVELAQNEVFDRNFYQDGIGKGIATVSHFIGAGALEFSADETNWIAAAETSAQLFTNDVTYPQYLRPSGTGNTVIHFVLKK